MEGGKEGGREKERGKEGGERIRINVSAKANMCFPLHIIIQYIQVIDCICDLP